MPDGPQPVLALADGVSTPGSARSTCAGDVAPRRWSLPRAGGTGSGRHLLKPEPSRHSIHTQTDGLWLDPDAAKGVRVAFACPPGSEPASSVPGASCPITPNAMMTRCSAADFLGRVRRIFTFVPLFEQSACCHDALAISGYTGSPRYIPCLGFRVCRKTGAACGPHNLQSSFLKTPWDTPQESWGVYVRHSAVFLPHWCFSTKMLPFHSRCASPGSGWVFSRTTPRGNC